MLSEQIFQLVEPAIIAVLATLAATLAAFLIRLARQQFSHAQWRIIEEVASQVVQAAEQYGGLNAEKKRQALDLAQEALTARGIHLGLYELDVAIEAAVWREINRFRSASGPAPGQAVSLDGTHATEPA